MRFEVPTYVELTSYGFVGDSNNVRLWPSRSRHQFCSQLLVGCDDSYIRVLKNNQFMLELTETGPVMCLAQVSDVRFSYGLANGTIGIYEEGIRLWRVKVSS